MMAYRFRGVPADRDAYMLIAQLILGQANYGAIKTSLLKASMNKFHRDYGGLAGSFGSIDAAIKKLVDTGIVERPVIGYVRLVEGRGLDMHEALCLPDGAIPKLPC